MKTIQFFLLLTAYCLLATSSLAQRNVEFTKYNFPGEKKEMKVALKQIEEGDVYYGDKRLGIGKYKLALKYYLKANEFNPNNALLNLKLGDCYLYTIYKARAIKYLEKAKGLDPNVHRGLNYLLGRAHHLESNFDMALDYYKKYKVSISSEKSSERNREVDKKIQECQVGKKLVANRTRAFVDNLGSVVNSPFPDYAPLISADESVLIFTSRRSNTTGGQRDPNDQDYYEDLYMSINIDEKWTFPRNMGSPINTESHDASVNLTADGQKLFMYKDLGTKGGGDIFICKLEGDQWSKPRRFPKPINSDSHESSACYSFDERVIYFVSDRPGGLGGRDMYMCRRDKKGKWEKNAQNLGPTINTPYDEEGLFMHPDGKTIYFSSQGHKTMGGYDIFKSTYEKGRWSEPENLGFPINTPDNDVYFVVSASGEHGYYASNRLKGQGEKDIYVVTFLGPEKPMVLSVEDNLLANQKKSTSETIIESVVEVRRNLLTILKGVVTDAITQQAVGADIELVDNEKNELIATFESNSKTGKYLISLPSGKNYGIAVKAEGYLFHSENFDIPAVSEYQEIIKNIELKKVVVGSKIVLNNVFFDFNKSTLRPTSFPELARLVKMLRDLPNLKIEISGHTDSRGSDAYNLNLSHSRAKSVVDNLIKNGISASRLQYKGYGETQPIATNDTEKGRQLNRRTEFKVLSN